MVLDGTRSVQDASVKLSLNGQAAAATPERTANRVVIRYSPDASRPNPANAVKLDFADAAGTASSRQWSFTINAMDGSSAPVTGQWDFDGGNLAASVGTAPEYLGGPGGLTAQGTSFGTTASFGIEDIGGPSANGIPVALTVAPPAAPPTVVIARDAAGIKVTFTGTLQAADTVTGSWTDVASTSPYSAPAGGTARFFRAKAN